HVVRLPASEVEQIAVSKPLGNAAERYLDFAFETLNRDRAGYRVLWQPLAGPVTIQCLEGDRKSTRLNSSHVENSYAVFSVKKKMQLDVAAADLHRLHLDAACGRVVKRDEVDIGRRRNDAQAAGVRCLNVVDVGAGRAADIE